MASRFLKALLAILVVTWQVNSLASPDGGGDFPNQVKATERSTPNAGLDDDIPGLDGELVAAIRKGDATKVEAALAAGANPNLSLCHLAARQYRTRYGIAGNAACLNTNKVVLLDLVLSSPYPRQPGLIAALARYNASWGLSGEQVISRLSGSTNLYDRTKKSGDYIQEKIAVARALHDHGFVFLPREVSAAARHRQSMNQEEPVAVIKGIADLSKTLDAFENGRQQAAADKANQQLTREREQKKLDDLLVTTQESLLAAERAESLRLLPTIKTIGQKICKTVEGTERPVLNSPAGPIYGQAEPRQFYITAFTERAEGEKIQVRVGGIRKQDGNRLVNIAQLNGDTTLQTNSLVWDDPMRWRPCN